MHSIDAIFKIRVDLMNLNQCRFEFIACYFTTLLFKAPLLHYKTLLVHDSLYWLLRVTSSFKIEFKICFG